MKIKRRHCLCRSDASSPVIVKPGAVAGDDDVVSLFCHIVLAGVHQTIDFSFALFLVILQKETDRQTDGSDRSAVHSIFSWDKNKPGQADVRTSSGTSCFRCLFVAVVLV